MEHTANDLPVFTRTSIGNGAMFAAALLTILCAHELGHFIAARIHKVDASLPYFLPMPYSPFGTMGAVIRMRGTIPTRKALLDIGASGPLAGLVFALPMYAWGVAHSTVRQLASDQPGLELGEGLLEHLFDRVFGPLVPAGSEIVLHPVAFAAWGGMFVTMINLIPVGQLDGGHVAYALFGPRQDRFAQVIHRSMLAFFAVGLGSYVVRDLTAGFGLHRIGQHIGNSLFWLVWFEVIAILGSLSSRPTLRTGASDSTLGASPRIAALLGLVVLASVGQEHPSPKLWIAWFLGLGVLIAMEARGGALRPNELTDHPATGAAPLGKGRAAIAVVTLLFFAALFMPTPFAM
jgi:hypothetical protein